MKCDEVVVAFMINILSVVQESRTAKACSIDIVNITIDSDIFLTK